MKLVGHRGAKGLATENTVESLLRGMHENVDALEFDLVETKDNRLVLHHDPNLLRIYGKDIQISQKTLGELQKITKDSPTPIISIEEALDVIGEFPTFIELKESHTAHLLIQVLKKHPRANVLGIISFKKHALTNYKKHGGKLSTYLAPKKRNCLYVVSEAKRAGIDGVVPHTSSLLMPSHLLWARLVGLKLCVYPVNKLILAKIILILHPDAYICTDYPDRYNKSVKKLETTTKI